MMDLRAKRPAGGRLRIAILLGLLTFVITPIVAVIVAVPSLFLSASTQQRFNPVVIVGNLLRLRELGGFFIAQMIVIAALALLGDLGTALLSWLINRSTRLAGITFLSALVSQLTTVAITIPVTSRRSQASIQSGIASERAYQQYATLGTATFELLDPYSEREIDNPHPEYGPIYQRLRILVPVSVSQPGTYEVHVRYRVPSGRQSMSTPGRTATATLGRGVDTVRVEFLAREIRSYGFWSPSGVGGVAEVQLSYLASARELLDKIHARTPLERAAREQLLEDEQGDGLGARSREPVRKFVQRRDTQF